MKKTKYLGKTFDNNWRCEHVGVARTQPVFYKGTKVRTLRPGHQTYYYLFIRRTSDGKFEKMVRLNAMQAAQVYKGAKTVEYYSTKKKNKQKENKADILNKVGYYFID